MQQAMTLTTKAKKDKEDSRG